jgi:hypothetical protein
MVRVKDKPGRTSIPEKSNGTRSAVRDLAESVLSEEEAVRVVRTLVETSRIHEARERIGEFLRIWPDSQQLQYGKRILTPTVAKVVPSIKPNRSRIKENQWIKDHARNYPGEWLLIFEDRLIASGHDLREVIRVGRTSEPEAEGVLWFQPGPDWC